jgi:hypothetical protein
MNCFCTMVDIYDVQGSRKNATSSLSGSSATNNPSVVVSNVSLGKEAETAALNKEAEAAALNKGAEVSALNEGAEAAAVNKEAEAAAQQPEKAAGSPPAGEKGACGDNEGVEGDFETATDADDEYEDVEDGKDCAEDSGSEDGSYSSAASGAKRRKRDKGGGVSRSVASLRHSGAGRMRRPAIEIPLTPGSRVACEVVYTFTRVTVLWQVSLSLFLSLLSHITYKNT